eukprot:GHRR01023634.1.p1 GENE.GHRR01023634.1~~GHRR01023634.1.p1  ORF type:complete len:143 (-),score=43.38 GHRR01023634.1:951-1379(-)
MSGCIEDAFAWHCHCDAATLQVLMVALVIVAAAVAGKALQQLVVKSETALIRPYVVAAVLRGVTFDTSRYNSFIDLQVRTLKSCMHRHSMHQMRNGAYTLCSWSAFGSEITGAASCVLTSCYNLQGGRWLQGHATFRHILAA